MPFGFVQTSKVPSGSPFEINSTPQLLTFRHIHIYVYTRCEFCRVEGPVFCFLVSSFESPKVKGAERVGIRFQHPSPQFPIPAIASHYSCLFYSFLFSLIFQLQIQIHIYLFLKYKRCVVINSY